jgi:hypothetical protein
MTVVTLEPLVADVALAERAEVEQGLEDAELAHGDVAFIGDMTGQVGVQGIDGPGELDEGVEGPDFVFASAVFRRHQTFRHQIIRHRTILSNRGS